MLQIDYLSPKRAFKYFQQAPHIRMMHPYEISLRTHGKTMDILSFYRDNLLEFEPDQMQVLTWYCNAITPYIEKFAPKLMPQQIKFILLKEGTEWDFPFTLAKGRQVGAIVLTTKVIERARYGKETRNDQLVKEFMNILTHELVHIHQKQHQSLYDLMYQRHFGMREKNISLDQKLINHLITNPDGYQLKWAIPFDLKEGTVWFMPAMIVDKDNHMREVLLRLKTDYYGTGRLYNDSLKMIPVEAFPLYTDLYGFKHQVYHPNEIAARLLSEYVILSHNYDSKSLASQRFYLDMLTHLQ